MSSPGARVIAGLSRTTVEALALPTVAPLRFDQAVEFYGTKRERAIYERILARNTPPRAVIEQYEVHASFFRDGEFCEAALAWAAERRSFRGHSRS